MERRRSMIVHIPVSLGSNEGVINEGMETPPKRSSFSVAGLLNDVEDNGFSTPIAMMGGGGSGGSGGEGGGGGAGASASGEGNNSFSIINESDASFLHPDEMVKGSKKKKVGSTPKSNKANKVKNGSSSKRKSTGSNVSGGSGGSGGSGNSNANADGNNINGAIETTPSGGPKRTYNRTYQTLLIATKVRHLKKGDGEPLWRVDIQYDFLSSVFHNNLAVFGNSYDGSKHNTFADIYVDAMARSSKCSKVLREKLLGDKQAGLNMAMVCLLVNVGRMNTTLNFFPEMKAQLRTYHPIPSLQSRSNQSDYKQLQDAPRLKSILKGACEDRPEPGTIEDLMEEGKPKPRTNPINLLFLLSTYAAKVEETFFTENFEFFDLIMNKEISSESRARAFLWLVYAYLETDLKPEQLRANPFGFGQLEGVCVPTLRRLSPEEVELENVDPISEKEFGAEMTKVRSDYLMHTNQLEEDSYMSGVMNNGTPESSTPIRFKRIDDIPINKKRKHLTSTSTPTSRRSLRTRSISNYKEIGELSEDEDLKPKVVVKLIKRSKEEEERERRCNIRIKQMLQEKYERRKRIRHKQGAIRTTWFKIKDLDAFYNSDEDIATLKHEESNLMAQANINNEQLKSKRKLKRSTITPTQIPSSLDEFPGDYGEEQTSITRALRRSIRWNENSLQQKQQQAETEKSEPRPNDIMGLHNLLQEVS